MNYRSALIAIAAYFVINVAGRSTLDLGSPCSMTPAANPVGLRCRSDLQCKRGRCTVPEPPIVFGTPFPSDFSYDCTNYGSLCVGQPDPLLLAVDVCQDAKQLYGSLHSFRTSPSTLPAQVPLTTSAPSCIDDTIGICLGLQLCFAGVNSVEPLYRCVGHLLQLNETVVAIGYPKRNQFPSSIGITGRICDNAPFTMGRCGPSDFCLYHASSAPNLPAICTRLPTKVSLPPQITSLDSSKPTCVQDTSNLCKGFWICYIGNNGIEPVYYCDGEIDDSNGFSNYIGWSHLREVTKLVVDGVANSTTPRLNSVEDGGPQNVGLIAGISVAAALILAVLGYCFYYRLNVGKNPYNSSDGTSIISLKSSKTVDSVHKPNQSVSNLPPSYAFNDAFQYDTIEGSVKSNEYLSNPESLNHHNTDAVASSSWTPNANTDYSLLLTPTAPKAPASFISIPSIPTTLFSTGGDSGAASDTTTTTTASTNIPKFSANTNVHSVPGFYRSLQDYTSNIHGELSYTVDSRVYVTSKPDAEGWCHALIGASAGRVHSSCLGTYWINLKKKSKYNRCAIERGIVWIPCL
ncbi:hypothetical protein BDR26DRAFT_1004481 [Obelidium mucronatum]|nr:hypothetical protein BDR26DRAFT_1004481 [Obelidium mucronatum]